MNMVGIFVKIPPPAQKKNKKTQTNNSNIVNEYFGEDSILYYTW